MIGPILLSAQLAASTPTEVSQWVRSRPTPAGQLQEMARFGVSTDYAKGLARWVRSQLARKTAVAVAAFRDGNCTERSTLRVQAPGFPNLGDQDPQSRFEGSVFSLETTGCLAVPDMAAAEQVYNSEAFRVAEMPNLASLQQSGGTLCLRSDAVTGIVDATDFCLASSRMTADGLTVTHNVLRSNNTAGGAAPVFYREEVIVFAQLDGRVGLHRIIWTRGQEIGMAGRTILQRTATSSQSRVYRALEAWLSR